MSMCGGLSAGNLEDIQGWFLSRTGRWSLVWDEPGRSRGPHLKNAFGVIPGM